MASKTRQALNKAQGAAVLRERGTGESPATVELRRLQAEQAAAVGDPHDTIQALVPAAAAACAEGHLVSLSCRRGSAVVLFRIRAGEDWLDWYCADPEFAEAVSDAVVKAFSGA